MTTPENIPAMPPPERRVYCNRTLNLRSIRAVGYDMDYTLVHYQVEAWEQRAFLTLRDKLAGLGWPVGDVRFDPEQVIRGLLIDTKLGNLIKANRFGYVTRACHGTRPMPFDAQREVYGRTEVELSDRRFVFLNTLFSLSEASMYAQLVDRLDRGLLPGAIGYADLYWEVKRRLDEAHMEGELKAEILSCPEQFVETDPELVLTLLDQLKAGKRLLLITNSEWPYTQRIMTHALDRHLPAGQTWRDLFELVILSARKPDFFSHQMPLFELATPDGLLQPCPGGICKPGVYVGGDARQVEAYLGVSGEEILFVGDHIFTDVHVSKDIMRWRTALILRELEGELAALSAFQPHQDKLVQLMDVKIALEHRHAQLRIQLQRAELAYGPAPVADPQRLRSEIGALRSRLEALDDQISPLARESGELRNHTWGLLMRAGNDKSLLARQVEHYADVYTSRVSNLLHESPFAYLRAPRGSLPHDAVPFRE